MLGVTLHIYMHIYTYTRNCNKTMFSSARLVRGS